MPRLVERRWTPNPSAYGGWKQRAGFTYQAFIPDTVADLEIEFPASLVELMSEAAAALADLHASPHLDSLEALSRQLLRSESIASSRIEGLELSQRRLARALYDPDAADATARSVIGNIRAMEAAIGIGEASKAIATADILAIHRTLMEATNDHAYAGRIRKEQNWIGGNSNSPRNAEFIPPPEDEVPGLLADLCEFANRDDVPAIAQAAVAHAQFETIHPFIDGNGRVGRALIHVLLRRRGLAPTFVPPISIVLATNARVYVAGLTDYRNDNLIEWCRLFTAALRTAANHAASLGDRLTELQDSWRKAAGRPRRDSAAEKMIQTLPARPILDAKVAAEIAGVSYEAARLAVLALEDAGVLRPIFVGRRRNRAWEAPEVVALLDTFEWDLATPTQSAEPRRAAPHRRHPEGRGIRSPARGGTR